jgi:hypothetical protein
MRYYCITVFLDIPLEKIVADLDLFRLLFCKNQKKKSFYKSFSYKNKYFNIACVYGFIYGELHLLQLMQRIELLFMPIEIF